ncbi:hypothetical protein PUNSTDRAFT_104390 [Punctularia strigosozonata HHB-11173 SS5]|uniref:uncharacterized protein n=1 Tax=Punctularia strigosozonata (strain HHB-11173) TaxID=741275 RepID=UPI00044171E2|nr:uncharacterized protein PUNSTDRAFT_104390 [Punctularia strigosozonata HHB-11173 SS5]EIN06973.1 hypothetical protein PUNSTDRAFT_104390 [Punctularia strigosozonata HHB-11173 SS5]
MNVFCVGGSRNIGYHASIRLLNAGYSVTFLLRYPSCFDKNETIQRFVASGKAKLVKGDALNQDEVRAGWEAAGGIDVDLLLFTLGGIPSWNIRKGAVITPPDLCTRSLANVLRAAPPQSPPKLKVVVISSTGVTKTSHKNLPWTLRPMYGYLLRQPHDDKLGMERVLAQTAGKPWTVEEPPSDVLPSDGSWKNDLPSTGAIASTVVVRPALLTDGACTEKYRSSVGDHGKGFTTVSRKDVAHYVAENLIKNWEKWENQIVSVAY